jgi:hypothetical protein
MIKVNEKDESKQVVRFGDGIINEGKLFIAFPYKNNDKMIFYSFNSNCGEIWYSEGVETYNQEARMEDVIEHFNDDKNIQLVKREDIDITIIY